MRTRMLLTLLLVAGAGRVDAEPSSLNSNLLASVKPFAEDYSDVWGYVDELGREYALIGSFRGTTVVNVTDPAGAYVTGTILGPQSRWRDIKTFAHYAYVVNENSGGLQIIDLSDPEQPVEAGWYTLVETSHNLFIEENTKRAYLCATDIGELVVLSLHDPVNPQRLGRYSRTSVHDVYVRDNVAYLAQIHEGTFSAVQVDILFSFPLLAGPITYPRAFTHNTWLSDDGSHLFTTDENAGGHLRIWNIENFQNIRPVAEFQVNDHNAIVHNVVVHGDRAFLSYYTAGLRVLDVSDPSQPVEIAFYDTFADPEPAQAFRGAWGVYPFLPSGNVLVSDISRGLLIVGIQTAQVSTQRVGFGAWKSRFRRP